MYYLVDRFCIDAGGHHDADRFCADRRIMSSALMDDYDRDPVQVGRERGHVRRPKIGNHNNGA
ncbi:hypothetical protein ACIP96_06530 [Streptomyces nigra]|uniref:hypothetical protein n=1 Tax=Streptomyces nigra TaxID=1827580 RepID=UPI0037FE03A7